MKSGRRGDFEPRAPAGAVTTSGPSRRRKWRAAWLLLGIVLAPSVARAQRPTTPKKTVVRFGGDTIDGSLMRPDGDLFSSRPRLNLPSLVQPPKSFARAARRDLVDAADAVRSPHR